MRFVGWNSAGATRAGSESGLLRQTLGVVGTAALLLATTMMAGSAGGQVPVPHYQEPVEAPIPQPALPMPTPLTTNGTVVEYQIVRVNDQIIDNSDYLRAEQQLTQDAQQENLTPEELAEQRKNLLRDMIDTQLLLSRGKELGINVDADVVRQLDDIRKQHHFDTMDELQKAVEQSGTSYEDFKAAIKDHLIEQQVVSKEVGQNLRLTARDEQAYYNAHKQSYAVPEQVRLSEILIPTPDGATDAQVAQALAKADSVEEKLKAGANFADLAKQVSSGPTAGTGGDLGEYKRGALPKVLEDATFGLKVGAWTAPIRTREGYVVLKATAHTKAGIPPLSAVEGQVQQAIYEAAIKPALRKYLTDLRTRASIVIAPGFVDTGAAPNETQPEYIQATTVTAKKKKKKVEKARLDQRRAVVAGVAGASTTAAKPAASLANTMTTGKKHKKIRREKVRFGQAPRNALPATPEVTLAAGADQGLGGESSVLTAPGAAISPIDESANLGGEVSPLAPKPTVRKKTRYSDLAAVEDKKKAEKKAEKKAAKAKQEAALLAASQPAETKAVQTVPLGLGQDAPAKKKKKKRVKGEPKERLQQQAPAPPAAKPVATPIPPKSVRENGEPLVAPAPTNLPPVTVPADAQPAAPASPAAAQ